MFSFSQEVFVLVLSRFILAKASYTTELACGSVRAPQDFSKTSVRGQTLVVSEDYSLAVVIVCHEVHGRGM